MVSILSSLADPLRDVMIMSDDDAGYQSRLPARKELARANRPTTSGGSGFRGSQTVAAAENVTDFQKAQAMRFLGNVDSLEGVEARVGRKDGDHILYVNGETAGRFEGGSGVKQRNRIAAIINAMAADASKEEETTTETTTDTTDDKKEIVTDLNLEATDDTDESRAATETANEAYSEVADQSRDTFGSSTDVTDVVQQDSSFIDADLKAAQEKIAALEKQLAGPANVSSDNLAQVPVDQQNLNTSSALGGQQEAAASISTGAAEDDAIDFYTKGRRSTILTTPTGLLDDDEDESLRPRRGLIV